LHSWDLELANAATSIDAMRVGYAATLQPVFSRIAQDLLGVSADLGYQRGWAVDLTLEEALNNSAERDARLRTTTVGPHRADLTLRVEGVLARDRVSRGQQKMIATALVLAQILAGADRMGQRTVLLLDDPAAELDVDNLGKLLEVISTVPAQLVVTSLSSQGLSGMQIGRRFHVEQGSFTPVL
jgi:DNA replication and repair protein RecF